MQPSIEDRLAKVITLQRFAEEAYAALEQEHPEVWARLQEIEKAKSDAEQEKAAVRDELIRARDFKLRQIDGYNISVTRTVKLVVSDPEKVSQDYKRTEEVVDVKKAQEDMKVLGELPAGFEDKSIYKLNWREVRNG